MPNPPAARAFINGPVYRYGMLAIILALFASGAWAFIDRAGRDRSSPAISMVVASMLLFNHVVAVFLSPGQQRRMRIPQFVFLGVSLLYVVAAMLGVGRR